MNRIIKKTLIIIPAYNVETRLGILLKQLSSYKSNILFVDDGSTDGTYEILSKNCFLTLHYTENKGVSFAVNQGVKYASDRGYDSVVIMDADYQHDPQYISCFMEKVIENDLVIGNRFCSNGIIPDVKRNSNTLGSCIVESIFNQVIQDVSCGFKAFKLHKDIVNYIEKSTDFSIVFDLLIYSLIKRRKIATVNMGAKYFPEELWFTRKREIESFIKAIAQFAGKDKYLINNIDQGLKKKDNFEITVKGITFFFFFLEEYDGYIIQADKKAVQNYHDWREDKHVS